MGIAQIGISTNGSVIEGPGGLGEVRGRVKEVFVKGVLGIEGDEGE